MCLRYSSSVVAPMQRSSPRASAGLSRLAASIGALGRAGADERVQLVDEEDDLRPAPASTSLSTALSRSSNSPRNFAPATSAPRSSAHEPLVLERLGHVAADDALGDPLDDGRLADARLADEHGVVLRAAREDLHHAADLLVAADDRIDLALARQRRSGRASTSRAPGTCPPGSWSVTRWLPRTLASADRSFS